jgi:hypothetical protein
MPIEQDRHGNITITGQGIALYRLLAMRSAVRLEVKGIRMHRRSITAQAMRELGCKRKDVLATLDALIEAQGQIVRNENDATNPNTPNQN